LLAITRASAQTFPHVMAAVAGYLGPDGLEITQVDPADMLDNRSKWDELWPAR
jgi:hypothetical protein